MKKSRWIVIIVILVIASGCIYYFKHASKSALSSSPSQSKNAEVKDVVIDKNVEQKLIASFSDPKSTEEYTNTQFNFSFRYPKGFTSSNFLENGGYNILVQDVNKNIGFQIIITEFDPKATSITPEMIKQDIPDMVIVNPQEVILGKSGKGVAFESQGSIGKTREVWFVYKGNVYQITAPFTFDQVLQQVLNTWKFL